MHYLTDTRPFLFNPWPRQYNNVLQQVITDAEQRRPYLPVAVMQKGPPKRNKNASYIRDYIISKSYTLIWQSDLYEIWLPPWMTQLTAAANPDTLSPTGTNDQR
jgi:hypothetical protein